MASPFRLFRKYLKPLMVVLGVLIMFSFVILDPLAKYLAGGRGGGGDPIRDAGAVAASWEGGSLTNQELTNLVMRRAIVVAFIEQVEGLGAQSSLMAGLEPPPLRVTPLRLADSAQEGVERSVVQTELFAAAAREAGMKVDNNAIVQYLFELGRGRVSKEDMRAILGSLQSGNPRVSIDYVFDGLRDELLARNFLMSNSYAAQTVTPQQRFQDWLRVNDRVVVEAAALPVESYLVEVKDPTDAELKAFYDEYKDREYGPDLVGDMELPSSRPGFREPRTIDVQFLQANFNDLVAKTEGEITEEEIAKYYEENKDLFIKADTGLLDDVPGVEAAPPTDGAATEEAPAAESESGDSVEDGDNPQTDSEQSASTESEDAAVTEDSPTNEAAPQDPVDEAPPAAPVESPPATQEESETAPPDDAKQTRSNRAAHQSVFRQAAFLQEAPAETETSEPPAPIDEAAPTEDASTPATDAAPPEDAAPATDSAAEPAPPSSSEAPATTTEPPATTDATAVPPAAEKPTEYQPLEEVRDLIRRDLAYRRANEKVTTIMDEVLGELTREFNSYFDRVLQAQANDEERPAPQPALADPAALAEKHGLTLTKTGPVTWLEFRETPAGESTDPADPRIPLSYMLFGNSGRELYQPILTVNTSDGDRYISMKTSETPARVPELSQIRDKVVRAWKLQKAAEFALKDAEKQAQAAEKAGSSLADFYAQKPAVEVERIDPFSFLTRGDVADQFGQQRFRLSQPDGIVAPGPELLGKVFELNEGEVGAALNHDHSIAYVIRVVEHQDSPDVLRNVYLAEANTWDGLAAMTEGHITRARQSIVAEIAGSDGVDWKRDPDNTGEPEAN